MKRKVYFIVSSVIQIITSIYGIINANKLGKSIMDTMNMFMGSSVDGTSEPFIKNGNMYIIFIAIICIVLNSLIILWACKDKLLKNKGKVIACSVISIFTSTYAIIELLAIVNVIVMANSKRVNPEDFPDKKKDLPVLKREEINKKNTIGAIILLAIYFSQFIWGSFIDKDSNIKIIISIVFYVGMIILSIIFFKDLFINNFRVFKKDFKAYFQNLVPLVGKYYVVYFLLAIIAVLLSNEFTSVNQENVMSLPIFVSFPLAVIYAPIVEETLFRGCIRRFIKNDKIFIVVSALVFGLLHTAFSEETLFNTLVMSIPYATMGGFLAYLYTKTNNMFSNMSFHCFHNTIAMIISLLIR